jgi:regulator of protease activity HflC (stomatin/prohibitin superfamily)
MKNELNQNAGNPGTEGRQVSSAKDGRQAPPVMEERTARASAGMPALLLNLALTLLSVLLIVFGAIWIDAYGASPLLVLLIVVGGVCSCIVCPIALFGLKILKPNEALVLTLFGSYYGTLKGPGFFFVNPFVAATNPVSGSAPANLSTEATAGAGPNAGALGRTYTFPPKKNIISLKALTLNNDKQKINDKLGNPIIIGIVVIWRVVNTAKAVFSVDNYAEFMSIQCDSALRNIVRLYPYDAPGDDESNEKSLRGSSIEIAEKLKDAIQAKVDTAGLEVVEARITHLSYAQEIAAAMLQRQQASAIIDARQMIVDGAVGMVEMALAKLSDKEIVKLDEERKAAMVSNLLVVLCANRDAQPIINSGTLY